MKYIFSLLLVVVLCASCAAQVKVSSFPVLSSMPDSFRIQDIQNKQTVTAATARQKFNAGVVSTAIAYVPSATGNTAYLNAFVKDPTGDVWFIDFTGRSMKMGSSAAAQVNSNWNATSGVAQILNKPTIPAAQVSSNWKATSGVSQVLNKPVFNQGLQQVGDSIQLGGYINTKKRLGFASGNDGGELLLEGGRTESIFSNTRFPLKFQELYNSNNANYEQGIGLQLHTKDSTGSEINSAVYNFDGSLNVQTDKSLNLYGSYYGSLSATEAVVLSTPTGSGILTTDNSTGLLQYDLSNGAASGLISRMSFKGGLGNDSYFRLSNYLRTRTDTSEVKNFLYTNTTGTVCSKPISALTSIVSGGVDNGLTISANVTGLGGSTIAPATINSQRQIDFSTQGSLILKGGLQFGLSNQTSVVPLIIKGNGIYRTGLAFQYNSLNDYDGIVSESDKFSIAAGNLRGMYISSNAECDITAANIFHNSANGFIRSAVSGTNNVSTLVGNNGILLRNANDSLRFGKVVGYSASDNYLQLSNYKNTRNDLGLPVNVLTTDARGVVQSHPASELPGAASSGVYNMIFYYNGLSNTSVSHYVKVGNMVTVSFNHDFNAIAFTSASVTLPFASSFTNETDVKGSATVCNRSSSNQISNVSAVLVRAINSNAMLDWTAALGVGQGAMIGGQFTYQIAPSN